MLNKLKVNNRLHFLFEDAKVKRRYDDEVVVYAVVDTKKYFVRQDTFNYEIRHIFQYFCDSANYAETTSNDLGYDRFVHQNDLSKDINSRNLREFDGYCGFFSGDVTVSFYKKAGKMYCQISQNNDWSCYKSLCVEEITPDVLEEWKQLLNSISESIV